jgi:DNA-binding transcriptional LysR family regulator
MAVDLLQLKSISAAARLGSLSRAAETLNITQSALSRRISDAERSLGLVLFERQSRGVRATEACLAFLRHAELALVSIDEGREAALDVQGRRAEPVAFGLLEIFCDDAVLAACRPGADGQSVNLTSFTLSAEVSGALISGAVKLGLRYRRDASPQLESAWIANDPVVVACAASHPLAARRAASMDELERAQWIGYPTVIDRTTTSYQEGLRQAGLEGWRAMNVMTTHARLRMIEAGLGVGLVRRACIGRALREGRVVALDTPLSDEIPMFLCWRRGGYLGAAAEALRDRIAKACRDQASTA